MNTQARILIVENEALIAQDLKQMLTALGYTVTAVAASGENAMQQTDKDLPDLVLMDIELAGEMDGLEVAEHIRARYNIPILYLTTHSEQNLLERAKVTEPFGFILKPCRERELQSAIEVVLYKYQMETKLKETNRQFEQEIAERKQAEEILRMSEKRFKFLYERAPLAYQSLDEDGNLLEVNRAWLDTFGYSREEVIGQWFGDFLTPDYVEQFKENFPRFKTLGEISGIEYEMVKKDGSHVIVSINGKIGYDRQGNFEQTQCILHDITAHKQAEETLKASEARFRELFNNMSSGVAVYEAVEDGQDFIFKDFNRAGERIENVQKDDLIEKSVVKMFPGVKEFGLFEVFQRVWRTGKPEHHPISLYQDERIVGWRENYVYKLPSGEIVAVYDDITERKRTEAELEKHRYHLEELVKERTTKLQREIEERKRVEKELATAKETAEEAQRVAEAASHAKSEFLANMSHELRTPLNAILGYAQILRDANNLTERQRKGLNTIKSSGEHLLNMINEILDLSKIEAGQQELQESEFYFPEFLKNITNIIQVRAEQKGIAFVHESDLDLPEGVCADEKRLQEVLINLLDNAVKFTEKGKVMLQVTVKGERRKAKGKEPQEKVLCPLPFALCQIRFQVEDTGIGIAPEKLEEIFLPFQQGGAERYTVEGTGLGLAISYRLVHLMGGKLYVQSTLGKGSVFWFDLNLPVVEHAIASSYPERIRRESRKIIGYTGKRRRILIADDQAESRGMLVDRLSLLGFDILEAEDGQECVEKTLNDKPDIILLDLLMPVMNGFEAVQQIRGLDTGYSILDTGLEHPASNIQPSSQYPQVHMRKPDKKA